jgi:Glycosyltransferase like family 2
MLHNVSFCIITNGKRPQKLYTELESIHALSIPRYEIIVCGTLYQIPEDITYLPLHEAAEKGQLGAMRNHAVRHATLPWVVVCDDDMIFHRGFYGAISSSLQKASFVSTQIRNVDGSRYWDWASIGGRRGHELLEYWEQDSLVYITGGLCVGWRDALLDVGWDEERGIDRMEDVDFSRRLQSKHYKHIFCSDAVVTHNDDAYYQIDKVVNRTFHWAKTVDICPGIQVQGVYRASGEGLMPMHPRCRILVEKEAFGHSDHICCRLQTLEVGSLLDPTLRMTVRHGAITIGEWELPPQETAFELVFPLPAIRDNEFCAEYDIEFSSFALPYLRYNPTDRRAYSLYLRDISFVRRENSSPLHYHQSANSSRQGVYLLAPLFGGTITTLVSRLVVEVLRDGTSPVQSECYDVDLFNERGYVDPVKPEYQWMRTGGEVVSEGTLVFIASPRSCRELGFIARHRERLSLFKKALLIIVDDKNKQLDEVVITPEEFSLFDKVYTTGVSNEGLSYGALAQRVECLPQPLLAIREQSIDQSQDDALVVIASCVEAISLYRWREALAAILATNESVPFVWLFIPTGNSKEKETTIRRLRSFSSYLNKSHPERLGGYQRLQVIEEGLSYPLFRELLSVVDSYIHLGVGSPPSIIENSLKASKISLFSLSEGKSAFVEKLNELTSLVCAISEKGKRIRHKDITTNSCRFRFVEETMSFAKSL